MKPILDGNAVKLEGVGRFSFNNKKEAEILYNTLLSYQKQLKLTEETSKKLDKITRQVIQIRMSIKIIDFELKKLKLFIEEGDE